jgi:hypothetical protein
VRRGPVLVGRWTKHLHRLPSEVLPVQHFLNRVPLLSTGELLQHGGPFSTGYLRPLQLRTVSLHFVHSMPCRRVLPFGDFLRFLSKLLRADGTPHATTICRTKS